MGTTSSLAFYFLRFQLYRAVNVPLPADEADGTAALGVLPVETSRHEDSMHADDKLRSGRQSMTGTLRKYFRCKVVSQSKILTRFRS